MSNPNKLIISIIFYLFFVNLYGQPTSDVEVRFKVFSKNEEIIFNTPLENCIDFTNDSKYSLKVSWLNGKCIYKKPIYNNVIRAIGNYVEGEFSIVIIKYNSFKNDTMIIDIQNTKPESQYGLNISFNNGYYIIDINNLLISASNKINFGLNITPENWDSIKIE